MSSPWPLSWLHTQPARWGQPEDGQQRTDIHHSAKLGPWQTPLVSHGTVSVAEPSAGFKAPLSRCEQLTDYGRQGKQNLSVKPQFIARPARAPLSPPPALHPDLLLLPAVPQTAPCPHPLHSASAFEGSPPQTTLPDLILLCGALCATLYPLKGSLAWRGLRWGNQACLMAPPSLHSELLSVQVPLRGLGPCWVGWPGQVSFSSCAQG